MVRRLALIIGNSVFRDPSLARLLTPDADVGALADVLLDPEIGGFDDAKLLVNMAAASIRRSISQFFGNKSRDDLLLLYFSGHGVLDEYGRLYLATKETERDYLRGTAIPTSFITDEMDHSRSRRQVLVLDCCHSGAFARGSKGSTGASVGTATAFEGKGFGRVVLTASDATQYAWEGDQVIGEAENSVFTHYLIKGLQSGRADGDGDGEITVDELYDYVYEQVVSRTPKQTPGKWSYKEQGEIIIARAAGSGAPRVEDVKVPELKEEIEAKLERLYNSGLEAYWLEEWEKATRAFQAIVSVRPDYPGAADRLLDARKRGELAALYEKARAALKSEDWEGAVTVLEALVAQAPEYKDAAGRLKTAKEQKRLTDLYAEAKQLYGAKKWQGAKKVLNKLIELAPDFDDYEDLQTRVEEGISADERLKKTERLYSRALGQIEQRAWQEAQERLLEIQELQPGYRESERLLAKVGAEIERTAEEEKELTYRRAMREMEDRNWRAALNLLNKLRRMDPNFKDIRRQLARVNAKIRAESASPEPIWKESTTIRPIWQPEAPKDSHLEENFMQRALTRLRSFDRRLWALLGILGLAILAMRLKAVAEINRERASQTAVAMAARARPTQTAAAKLTSTAEANPLVYGPISGRFDHDNDEAIEWQDAGVSLRDFIAEASFDNPYGISKGSWDISFLFRRTFGGEYRLVLRSDGEWWLIDQRREEGETIASGNLGNLNTDVGGSNKVKLIAFDSMGLFILNDRFVAPLDLTNQSDAGEIAAATGVISGDEIEGESTPFQDFRVWRLVPALEPLDGTLTSEIDDSLELKYADVDLQNFVADAVFHDPQPPSEDQRSFGYVFRGFTGGHLRLIVTSGSFWWLQDDRHERSDEIKDIHSGPATSIDTGPGGANRLTLIALGDQGYAFLNEVFMARLDLSSLMVSGDIAVATDFFSPSERDNQTTEFENFTVWLVP